MDGPTDPDGGDARPTLRRPPGERYAAAEPAEAAGAEPAVPSTARAVARAALVGLLGTVALVVLGGAFAMTAGLLVVAAVIGWAIGWTVRTSAGPTMTATTRRVVAVALALDATVLGQVGLWLFAATQGGTLGLIDYLAQARGPLVIAEIVIAAIVAWWTAR